MTAHCNETARTWPGQSTQSPTTKQSFVGVVGRMLGMASFAVVMTACGFVDGPPETRPLSEPADAQSSTPAVETVAPQANAAATVSRPSASTGTTSPSRTTTTTTTTPTTTPTTPSSPAGTLNTIDTIVSDMRLKNDAVLRYYENRTVGWYVGPGIVQLGNDPRMTNAPDWFKSSYPSMINDTYMRAMLPWLVIFDGVDHNATNTRVHLRNMRAFYKSRSTGEWRSLGMSPGASGFNTSKTNLVGGSIPEDKRKNADGSVEIKPPSDTRFAWHGWWDAGKVTINPTDIQAVFVTVQARLTVDNPAQADDRSRSQYLLQTGADYYYDAAWQWTVGQPGVGTSRSKLVKNDWQAFNMMTFTDVGLSEPGGGITEAQFRAAPPPLE
jgi:hypothetical protein